MAENNTILMGVRNEPTGNAPTGKTYFWMGTNGHLFTKNDQGVVIDQGEQGEQGVQGEQGIQGPQGVQGIQGIQGVQGEDGDTGPQGDTGPVGPMKVEYIVNNSPWITLPNTTNMSFVVDKDFTVSGTGDCYLDLSMAIRAHSASSDMEFEFYIDGNFIDIPYAEEHKDSGTDQENWRSYTGMMLGSLSAGTHTIAIYFSKEATGGTAILKTFSMKVVRYS